MIYRRKTHIGCSYMYLIFYVWAATMAATATTHATMLHRKRRRGTGLRAIDQSDDAYTTTVAPRHASADWD